MLAMPASADVRPSVASISKANVKLAGMKWSDGMRVASAQRVKGVDGKPKNGHPDDPSRPHPERTSP